MSPVRPRFPIEKPRAFRRYANGRASAARAGARFVLGCALAASIALACRSARAEAFDVGDTTWEGCSELLGIARAELGQSRVVPVGVLDWKDVSPSDGVLVLHPMHGVSPDDSAAFLKAGGRLAILDDYGRGDETLARFRIQRAPMPARPVEALRNRPELAIAEPVIETVAAHSSGPHPVVSNVQRLVLNHATALRHPNLSPVLKVRAIGEADAIVAVAGVVGEGRLFAMGDPSTVINEMLRYPGNRAFVAGLSRYLVDDEQGKRPRGRLFIVANRFHEEPGFGGETSARRELEADARRIADALRDIRDSGFPGWLAVALGALALVLAGVHALRSSARPYRRPLPRYARPVPLVAQGGVAGRLAMLAAPSSPRALALLELKSALFEAMAERFRIASAPSAEALTRIVERSSALGASDVAAFRDVLARMQKVEASVVAGRPAKVPASVLADAAKVVGRVLAACGASPGARPRGGEDAKMRGESAA